MFALVRAAGLVAVTALAVTFASTAPAATPKEIDAAIKKGADALKSRYAKGGVNVAAVGGGSDHGIGPTCLVGLALLESGTPVADPAIKTITDQVRNASYTEIRTYRVALCLMYLDRLGEPADVPLIQMLGVRLLVGQYSSGGWGYECCATVPKEHEQVLRAMKPDQKPGKLHPTIEEYGQRLTAARAGQGADLTPGDNSNTQFAVIGVWLARKHGVPTEQALDLIEQRFLASQSQRTGGWSYSGGSGDAAGSPSMHCAGLIGLATGVARREERRAKKEEAKDAKKDSAKKGDGPPQKSDDPFFNPPKPSTPEPKKAPARQPDNRDRAVQFALNGLGMILADSARKNQGALRLESGTLGQHDLYFYWSLERVGVIYGLDKIGGIDWYDAGAHTLVRSQAADGTWNNGGGGGASYGADVSTAFAVLFLCRSNLARDLSSKVQNDISTEMRAGTRPTESRPTDGKSGGPAPLVPGPALSGVVGSEAATLASELIRASEKDWAGTLKKLRDSKGTAYTQALVVAAARLEGDRRKEAREALAERLTRMTADTLRTMAKDEEIELRRGAVLAMAMKDDKAHIPDLVNALLDDEEAVVRAAKAGLKSLTGQDFGPGANASAVDKRAAVSAWKDWLSKQKK